MFSSMRNVTCAARVLASLLLTGSVMAADEITVESIHQEGQDALPQQPFRVPEYGPMYQGAEAVRGPFTFSQVNVDAQGLNIPNDAGNEPSIAINPLNPDERVIGWRQFDTITNDFRQAGMGYSDDGGKSWTFPGVLEPGIFRSDPVLAADSEGTFYYCSLRGDFSVHFFKSQDGGVNWTGPVPAFGGDKQWLVIDDTGGIGHGNIYMSWSTAAGCCGTRIFIRSIDGGETWSEPMTLPGNPIFGTVAVGAEGELYAVGMGTVPLDPSVFPFSRSSNARNADESPVFEFDTIIDLGGSVGLFNNNSPNPAGLLGQIWTVVDRSDGPTGGNVYVLASVDPPGPDPLDVMFVRSTDGGETWSAPIRVNDDVSSPTAFQWFGTISVAPNGRIDVFFNDTRNDPDVNFSELHYTYSTDGGDTWSVNKPISRPFNHFLGYPQQAKLGDYYHAISDDSGVSLAWAATFNGEQDVYHLRYNHLPGDEDGDGDLDGFDFAAFDGCFTGPKGEFGEGCDGFDQDGDGDVDFADFGALQVAFTGPCAATIMQQPMDAEACLGGQAVWQVSAEGQSLSYQWHHNGVNITGATGATLVVDPVNVLSGGSYGVTVQSACSTEISQDATLSVLPPPAISTQPADVLTCVGQTAMFSIEASAEIPPLTFQWQFNGENIEGATESTLLIDPVGNQHVGAYRCVLTDGCEVNLISQSATLEIPLVGLTSQPQGGVVCENDTIFLFVTTTGSATFQWSKDGEPIDGAISAFLAIPNATTDDAGVYTITVTGLCNAEVSDDAVIEIITCGT